ncbi:TerD family protein [Streptomyces cocklensis]|jgi:stress response protein SCP2|nr:TerD family protein [Actinacidiphila cocklensis]MDD1060547.1 TerD family protein [Actinacidiphila cocklensis]WSX73924.1 TerD family protein [Streptomyces sp. NBC_00899]WSX80011.1 TerD family protein [Streptomyces sp. NBC_00899]
MTAMTPGSNVPLSVPRVAVDVAAPVRLDVSGLLLTADGKVRSDDDFVFYNQPQGGPGVSHRSGGGSGPDAITVDTVAVPAGIEKIVVTASLDGGGAFAGTTPTATVRNADDGSVIATFAPAGLGPETALVVVEVYRRGGAWKVRAVGQGYANGLAGIATDFGVNVDEPAAAPAAPAPVAQAAPPAGPAASHLPPPPPSAPPAPAAPPAAPGRINLDKGRVSLRKNETVSLVKGGKPLLSSVRMGLGWEPAFGGRDIDLDASVIVYGPQRNHIETCYFGRLSVLNGAIQHSGDNLTGDGSGDDESITVHLGGLPPEATGLLFTVNSYSGQKFNKVAKAYCRLLDAASGEELVRFDLTGGEARTGVLMAKLIKQFSGEWEMTALGSFVDARTAKSLVKPGAAAL